MRPLSPLAGVRPLLLSLEYGSPLNGRQSGHLILGLIFRRYAHIDAVVAYASASTGRRAIFGIAAVAAGLDVELPAVQGQTMFLLLAKRSPRLVWSGPIPPRRAG